MSKGQIAGWVLSGLLSAFLIFASAGGKFTDWEGKDEMFAKFGFTEEQMVQIGYVEVAIAVLYLVPRVDFIATVLLTGYLGGATVTHVRVEDPFFMPIIIGVVAWIALGLRRPEVFRVAFGSTGSRPVREAGSISSD
ncbi:DoxX family protein [Rubinisphaera margarita]|uniref:DoxX family protein n=1 Tax=Rubinisphaera margarita TaxID=2909586 RepID=UPI001EE99DF7|nr:DoxX family protein [Rubinisphaera margarita]MCG6158279.1 DoxX family protein [Rubinisphaera margarita]